MNTLSKWLYLRLETVLIVLHHANLCVHVIHPHDVMGGEDVTSFWHNPFCSSANRLWSSAATTENVPRTTVLK